MPARGDDPPEPPDVGGLRPPRPPRAEVGEGPPRGRCTPTPPTTTPAASPPPASDSSKVVSDLSYCYSPHGSDDTCSADKTKDAGLRQWSKDQVSGKVSVYSHDTGNRLTKATNAAGHTYDYGYDADGNRTSVKTDGA